MDESFTHWRGVDEDRQKYKDDDTSITISDTDDDVSLPVRTAGSKIILESSDEESEDDVVTKSRLSYKDDIRYANSEQSDENQADESNVSLLDDNDGSRNVDLDGSYISDAKSTDVDSEDEINVKKHVNNNVINESDGDSDEPITVKRRVNRLLIEDSDEETQDPVDQKTQNTIISDEKISASLKQLSTSDSPANMQLSFEQPQPNLSISDDDAQSPGRQRDKSFIVSDASNSVVLEDSVSSDDPELYDDTDSDPAVENVAKIENVLPVDDDTVLSIVRKEIGISNMDPLVEQRRALLTCNIQQVQTQLGKSKMILKSANTNLLPDRGEKLRNCVTVYERELKKLSEELDALPPPASQRAQTPLKNAAVTAPPWKTLPASIQPKPVGTKALVTQLREQSLTDERIKDLHGSLKAMPDEDQCAEDPRGLRVSLMPHQKRALAWLLWREKQKPSGGILADDMGLGKTLTMISLIMATMKSDNKESESESENESEWFGGKGRAKRVNGGTLVVCPASVLSQWSTEIQKRVRHGMLSVELYHGNNREKVSRRLAKNDVVITTYNLLGRDFKVTESSVLHQIKWKRIILDEAHIVRNHKSQASEAVCGLHGRCRWALTGTPIQNKELDLYGLLKFLKCSPFDDIRVWKRWVDSKSAAGQQRLATVMKSLLLRRTKKELQMKGALEDLPDKVLEEIFVSLDPEEKLVYEKIMMYSRTIFATFLAQRAEKGHMYQLGAGKFDKPVFLQTHKQTQFTKVQNELLARHADVKSHEILVLLLRLRQVCCHPGLIEAMLDRDDFETSGITEENSHSDLSSGLNALTLDNDENTDPNDIGVDRRVVQNLLTSDNPVFKLNRISSKMRAVLDKIKEIVEIGDKAVVVSQWTTMLEIVRNHLDSMKGASYDMLTGKVAVKDRQRVIDAFNAANSRPNILLLSLTAGGVGLNLIGGNHLLLLDIHWNPQLEAQAQDRVYRVGQPKNVHVYKFICEDTIEQRIKVLQEHKLQLAQGVLSGAGTAGVNKLTLDDLKSLFSL